MRRGRTYNQQRLRKCLGIRNKIFPCFNSTYFCLIWAGGFVSTKTHPVVLLEGLPEAACRDRWARTQGARRDTISHPLPKCSERCLSCPERTHVEPTLVGICANITTETPPGGPQPWPTLSYQEPRGSHFTHRPAPEHGCV